MFGLFASKRTKFAKKGKNLFDVYIPSLKGMTSSEIGFVLAQAVQIKDASTMHGSKEDLVTVFHDPMLLPETEAFETLRLWERHMLSLNGSLEGRAKAASLSIWYLSVIACQIPELRVRGREMWAELQRGYEEASFNPDEDAVIGLEPDYQ